MCIRDSLDPQRDHDEAVDGQRQQHGDHKPQQAANHIEAQLEGQIEHEAGHRIRGQADEQANQVHADFEQAVQRTFEGMGAGGCLLYTSRCV